MTTKPNKIKAKCFIKKKYELVFNLSEAIKEVETKEKNNPAIKNDMINIKIVLSIFFHQL
jgi:hypothetical protein